eukprot:SAG31_NODE_9344_length_1292_cov_1.641241_2_plen_88_part_00
MLSEARARIKLPVSLRVPTIDVLGTAVVLNLVATVHQLHGKTKSPGGTVELKPHDGNQRWRRPLRQHFHSVSESLTQTTVPLTGRYD